MLGTELYFGAPQGFCGELKSLRMTQEQPDERQADGNLLLALDANILISSYLLQTAQGLAVIDLVGRAKGRILLPEVVELELKCVLGRRMAKEAERAKDRMSGLEAIIQRDIV
jgi:hypothetical protein